MGLSTDSIFISAISSDSELLATLGYVAPTQSSAGSTARIYSTAIPLPDEDLDNVPLPYVIVTFDGLNNDETTKDDPFESENDVVSIGIEVAAENRKALAELTQAIRTAVHEYMVTQLSSDEDFPIEDYRFSADAVQFDSLKPCYWQTLRYQCDVLNIEEEDNNEQN